MLVGRAEQDVVPDVALLQPGLLAHVPDAFGRLVHRYVTAAPRHLAQHRLQQAEAAIYEL